MLNIPLIRVLPIAVLSLLWHQKHYNQITKQQVLLLKEPGRYSVWIFFCHQHNDIKQKIIDKSTNLDSQTKKLRLALAPEQNIKIESLTNIKFRYQEVWYWIPGEWIYSHIWYKESWGYGWYMVRFLISYYWDNYILYRVEIRH